MSAVKHRQLSPHFNVWEFRCRCGCGFGLQPGDVDQRLVDGLEELRETFGGPLIVNSGCRCAKHNGKKDTGGVSGSQHTQGKAADIKCSDKARLLRLAKTIPAFRDGGIGVYSWGVHLDVGPKRRW